MCTRIVLLLGLLAGCQRGDSPDSTPSPVGPPAQTTNLGLATSRVFGSGPLRLVLVPEAAQGLDLDGDGDLLDEVVHVIDLERSSVVNTGLVLGVFRPRKGIPEPLVAAGAGLAFAVDEAQTGGFDRNGDGDAEDLVLALYERDSSQVTNTGLAVSHLAGSQYILAFDVPEADQGLDLDGDGVVSATGSVPFVHDRRTGETWNTGLRGTHVLGVQSTDVLSVEWHFVAMWRDESLLGDLVGDGDASDLVFDVYDVHGRTLQNVGVALPLAISGFATSFSAHRGRWAFRACERGQGTDLNGDGDALDQVAAVYDPRTLDLRFLGGFHVRADPELEPFVLTEATAPTSRFPTTWLYDAETDVLASTGLHSVDVGAVGQRIALAADEESQGEDLDGNGAFDSLVLVLYDFAADRREVIGIDAASFLTSGSRLLFRARESASRSDWNRDGDQEDEVLFHWDEAGRKLMNTGLATLGNFRLNEDFAFFKRNEAGDAADWNGDGDRNDLVLHVLEFATGGLTNTELAAFFPLEIFGDQALINVRESDQGEDLNGDGDQDDGVLHLVRVGL